MNIAQISACYKPIVGGQEVYIDNLTKILRSYNYNVKIYQPYRGVKSEELVTIIRIPYLGRVIYDLDSYILNLFLFLTKRKILAREQIFIVHYAFYSLPVWSFKDKVIIVSHGIEWHTESMTLNDRIREMIAKVAFDRFSLVANDTHYLRHFGLSVEPGEGYFEEVAPKKWFIPNCVNLNVFKRNEGIEHLKKKKIILVPRQITPDRGVDLAIKAFNLFNQQKEDFYLYIIGKPTKGWYFEYCTNLAAKYGISNKVIFNGFVENSAMPYYYSSALLTLIPTLRREGTSLSALESMACGTPTVSTNVAGLRDLPTIQSDPNPTAIADKLIFALENKDDIGREQHDKVKRIFNLENWSKAWIRVIEAVSERGRC